jgi:hypothetical protein
MFTAPVVPLFRLSAVVSQFFSLMKSESSLTVGPDALRFKMITKKNYMSNYSVIILSKLRPIIRLHLIILTHRSILNFVSVLSL